jgi:hypothetical protein
MTSARSISGSSTNEGSAPCVLCRKWLIRSRQVRRPPGQLGMRNYPDGYRIELIEPGRGYEANRRLIAATTSSGRVIVGTCPEPSNS